METLTSDNKGRSLRPRSAAPLCSHFNPKIGLCCVDNIGEYLSNGIDSSTPASFGGPSLIFRRATKPPTAVLHSALAKILTSAHRVRTRN
jgi:hypothetical protein